MAVLTPAPHGALCEAQKMHCVCARGSGSEFQKDAAASPRVDAPIFSIESLVPAGTIDKKEPPTEPQIAAVRDFDVGPSRTCRR